ncbi:Hypp4893 [Branchiostoma lanceolatum]|uniref:Hypp4893 protein n=1 Tax=Branchiostoma lanceolatum TaxID=7740 RepID=A0A8K0AB02_BRALA|nr:Hypp4893 [Branchiostoma lanceolatum]
MVGCQTAELVKTVVSVANDGTSESGDLPTRVWRDVAGRENKTGWPINTVCGRADLRPDLRLPTSVSHCRRGARPVCENPRTAK